MEQGVWSGALVVLVLRRRAVDSACSVTLTDCFVRFGQAVYATTLLDDVINIVIAQTGHWGLLRYPSLSGSTDSNCQLRICVFQVHNFHCTSRESWCTALTGVTAEAPAGYF